MTPTEAFAAVAHLRPVDLAEALPLAAEIEARLRTRWGLGPDDVLDWEVLPRLGGGVSLSVVYRHPTRGQSRRAYHRGGLADVLREMLGRLPLPPPCAPACPSVPAPAPGRTEATESTPPPPPAPSSCWWCEKPHLLCPVCGGTGRPDR